MLKLYKIYMSGPMSITMRSDFNYPEFIEKTRILREVGHDVLNMTEHGHYDFWEWEDYLVRDLQAMMAFRPNTIVLLKGWEKSPGVKLELQIGQGLFGCEVFEFVDGDHDYEWYLKPVAKEHIEKVQKDVIIPSIYTPEGEIKNG